MHERALDTGETVAARLCNALFACSAPVTPIGNSDQRIEYGAIGFREFAILTGAGLHVGDRLCGVPSPRFSLPCRIGGLLGRLYVDLRLYQRGLLVAFARLDRVQRLGSLDHIVAML